MRFTLAAGQKGDAPQVAALLEELPAQIVVADTAYDADHLRVAIAAKGAPAVIPNNPSRALKFRSTTSCSSTPFEKTARNYQAVVTLAAITLWMRQVSTGLGGSVAS